MGTTAPESDGDDVGLETILAEARAAYIEWIAAEMETANSAARTLDGAGRSASWDTVFGFFHNLKGGGGSVGLELLSAIGASACNYLRSMDGGAERAPAVMLAHLSATQKVANAGIRGDGGSAGQALMQKLKAISEA